MYDLNNFYINGKNRFTNNNTKTKCDSNGFDIDGVHKDINISSDVKMLMKKNVKKYSLVKK